MSNSYCIPIEQFNPDTQIQVSGPYDTPEDCNINCGGSSSSTGCPPGYRTVFVGYRLIDNVLSIQQEKCVKNCEKDCGPGECCLLDTVQVDPNNPTYSCQQCSDSYCCQAGNKIGANGNALSADECVTCDKSLGAFEIIDGICQCTSCNCDFLNGKNDNDEYINSEACKLWCCNDAPPDQRPQECNCTPSFLGCKGGKEPDSTTPPCECVCPSDKSVWACDKECKEPCASGKSYILFDDDDNIFDEECICSCDNSCKAPKVQNKDTCACECPKDTLWSCDKECLPPCPNEGEVRSLDENGDCLCSDKCPEDKPVKCTPDGGAQGCYAVCPGGTTRRDGECGCCDPGQVTCMKDGKKICDDPCNDEKGWVPDGDSCDCINCETGMNSNGQKEGAGNQVVCKGKCVDKCAQHQIMSANCEADNPNRCINKCLNDCYKFEDGKCIPEAVLPANGANVGGDCDPWQFLKKNGDLQCECVNWPCPLGADGKVVERDPNTGDCPGQNGPPVGPGPGGGSGGGGGGDGGGDGGGGGSSPTSAPCPPNASRASDGLCYCNSPSAVNIAGNCACAPNYVFDQDGVTCVPQGTWTGFLEKAKETTEKPTGYDCDPNSGCQPVYYFDSSYESLEECENSCQMHYSCSYQGCTQDNYFSRFGHTKKQCDLICKERFYCENNECTSVFNDQDLWFSSIEECKEKC